jgi:hypothetical protein
MENPTNLPASIRAALTRDAAADPVIALEKQMAVAENRYNAAFDALREAEHKAGLWQSPKITVGFRQCHSAEDVRKAAPEVGFSPERTEALVGVLLSRLALYRQERDAAGLTPFDQENDAAAAEWDRVMTTLACTPATTMAGLAVKLRRLVVDVREGVTDYSEELAESAAADAERLAKGGAA